MCLAAHPAAQDALAAELAEAGLAGGAMGRAPQQLLYDRVKALPYLEAVVKETMRLWPINPLGAHTGLRP